MSLAWRNRRRRHRHHAREPLEAKRAGKPSMTEGPHPITGQPMAVEHCRCGASRMLGHGGKPIVGMKLGRWMERVWA